MKILHVEGRRGFLASLPGRYFSAIKLTLILAVLSLGAAARGFPQKITFSGQDVPLQQVLTAIEKQTGYAFFYNDADIREASPISVHFRGIGLEAALKAVFSDGEFSYTIHGKTIFIRRESVAVPVRQAASPPGEVHGRVTDAAGHPLAGVSVSLKGTGSGGVTDAEGRYALNVPAGADTLVFSYVGFTTLEAPLRGRDEVNVILQASVASLNQLVVVGYGTQKKADVTGAISTVGPKELTAITTPDLSNALAGKLPGLRVMQIGGEPGTYDNNIDIRGWGNMLVIVDGVPRSDFQKIDPASIASVSILKDASAAVYGLKAANGVMLITTKKGVAGQTRVTLNSSYGWQKITEFPTPIRNAMDNLILKNEAALVAGNPLPYPDWEKYTGEDPAYPNVDWWGLTTREAMPIAKNSVSLSGGSDKVTYYMTFGTLYQAGIYKSNSLNYRRYNFRSNLTAEVARGLTANVILGGLVDRKKQPYGSSSYDFFKQVMMQPGYEPIYANNTAPYYYDGQADRNPLAIINSDLTGYRHNEEKAFQTTTSLTYDLPFLAGLQVKGLFAYDLIHDRSKVWRKAYNEYKYDEATDTYTATGLTSPTQLQQNFDETVNTEAQLSLHYQGSFGDHHHNVEALLLGEQRDGHGTQFRAQRDFALSSLDQLNAGLNTNQVASGIDKVLDANQALVGRFNYDYLGKYLAEFSFRYDGSSLFPPETRWGFFPGFSLGWRLSQEQFISDNLPFVDNLKLRFSYGKLGDNSDANGFEYLQGYTYPSGSYVFDGSTLTGGSSLSGIPNPNITWYTATTTNIGVDATLWHGMLDFTLELFQRKRDGLLATRAIALPALFGADLPQENLEGDLSRGFEITVGSSKRINDFSYDIRANLTFARAKWTHKEAAAPGNSYLKWRNSNEDRWKGIQWGYGVVDQFQNQKEIDQAAIQNANGHTELFPGDIHYEDWNEDGVIDDLDVHPIARSVDPEIFYGLNLTGGWRGLSLTLFFQGASHYSMMPTEQLQGPLAWGRNSLEVFLDRWHHQDPLDFSSPWVPGRYPISRDGFGFAPNKLPSTYWFHNITYMRLKSLELAYVLPASLSGKIRAQEVRLYGNAFNVHTWKNKDVDFDPEHRLGSGDGGDYGYVYPLMANYNLGISVTF